jgi:hypothetical protein
VCSSDLASLEKKVDGRERGWAWLGERMAGHEGDADWVAELARHIRRDGAGVPAALEQLVLEHADAATLYELVGGLYNGKEYTRCVKDVDLAGDRFPEGPLLGYRCALLGQDLAKVAEYREKMGATLPAAEATLDATLAIQKADYGTAERVLAAAAPKTDAELARVSGLRATLYTRQGRWDEAVTAASTKGVDTRTVTGLAAALARVGRYQQAKDLLALQCAALTDSTARQACLATVP